jgi:hypothetical protein
MAHPASVASGSRVFQVRRPVATARAAGCAVSEAGVPWHVSTVPRSMPRVASRAPTGTGHRSYILGCNKYSCSQSSERCGVCAHTVICPDADVRFGAAGVYSGRTLQPVPSQLRAAAGNTADALQPSTPRRQRAAQRRRILPAGAGPVCEQRGGCSAPTGPCCVAMAETTTRGAHAHARSHMRTHAHTNTRTHAQTRTPRHARTDTHARAIHARMRLRSHRAGTRTHMRAPGRHTNTHAPARTARLRRLGRRSREGPVRCTLRCSDGLVRSRVQRSTPRCNAARRVSTQHAALQRRNGAAAGASAFVPPRYVLEWTIEAALDTRTRTPCTEAEEVRAMLRSRYPMRHGIAPRRHCRR